MTGHGKGRARWWRGLAVTAAVCAVVPILTAAMPPPAYKGKLWVPGGHKPAAEKSVGGHALATSAGRRARSRAMADLPREPGQVPAVEYQPPKQITWPEGGATAALAAPVTVRSGGLSGVVEQWAGGPQAAGRLPVTVSSAARGGSAASAAAGVKVSFAGRQAAARAGIAGVAFTIAGKGALAAGGTVTVRLNYRDFADAYGGAWASRLYLAEVPSCALVTPTAPGCGARYPVVAGGNDTRSGVAWARVTLPSRPWRPIVGNAAARAETVAGGLAYTPDLLLATESAPGGPDGTYSATPLDPSANWAVQDGDFTYNYPIAVPQSLGGQAPSIALNYDSQSIDGETSGSNTQGGMIGDGWSYSPGFIERSYQPCSQSGVSGLSSSDDMCFDGYNATLSLGGHSSSLVLSSTSGSVQTYKQQNDDGTQVQLYQDGSNGSNGLWDNEYWVVTTTDGAKYYFGADHVPGYTSSSATNSAWGEPVYNPVSGDPCYQSGTGSNQGTASWCTMGWRWNLDFVVDPRGNLTEYNYQTESNYYNRGAGQASGNNGTLTQYVRAGFPVSAEYGMLLSDEQKSAPVKPAAEVLFGYAQRCLPVGSTTCSSYSNLTSSTASDWPDTPYSNICQSSGSCSNWGPTFFSTYRLSTITPEVLPSQSSTSYSKVDTYTLQQTYPYGATSGKVMFLASIQRTGNDGGTTALPAVTFTPAELNNRVLGSSYDPVDRPRISAITTETGEQISVDYRAPDCTQGSGGNVPPSEPDQNYLACYPAYWTPPGVDQAQIKDWFNKSLVSTVIMQDVTGAASPEQVVNYTYLGNAAWHWDESPVITKANRLWDEFRGYQQVETQSGQAPDPVTETIDTYMQGMYGNETNSGGTTTTQVTDPNGDTQNDYNWLSGEVMESDVYDLVNGAQTIEQRQVNLRPNSAYTQTASQTEPSGSGLSAMTADMITESQTDDIALQAAGSSKSDLNTTYFNGDALPVAVDHDPQGLTETCTSTLYANAPSANPMMENYPSQVTTVTGAYSTSSKSCPAASSSDIVADTKTYYDDKSSTLSLTGMGTLQSLSSPGGLVTGKQTAQSWPTGGSEAWVPESVTGYDSYGYGREISQTDADDNTTTVAYSPTSQVLPTSETVTNPAPFKWTTTTALNQGRQLPTSVTDPNSEVTTETYDGLGRLTSVTKPLDQGTGYASETYAYHVTGTSPPAITTSSLREDGSYSESVSIYDGMAQLRQVQTTPADNSAGRLITDTEYDSHGWQVLTSEPYYDSTTSPDTTLYVAKDSEVPSQTVTGYDELGRPVSSSLYSLGTQQWESTNSYLGLNQVDTTPPPGGTATTAIGNVLGQETQSWAYNDSATPTDHASDARVTSYGYNPAGQQTSVTDANGNAWTYTYNLLGQETSMTDPGTGTAGPSGVAGTSYYSYDGDSNVLSAKDPMNNVITYTYDNLGRMIAEYNDTTGTKVELASWQYDSLEKGQLTSSSVYDSGGQAYTDAVSGYNSAYEPTGTSMSIPSDAGALQSSTTSGSITQYTTQLAYTPLTGLPEYTAYTGDGNLPAEVVDYTYDLEGLLTQFGSGNAYLDNTTFTPQGQVTSTTFGPYGKQLVQDYTYDAGTMRMLGSTTNLQTLTQPADVTNYTYDPSGNITSINDTQDATSGQPDQLQCFQYNNLDELTQAWTDNGATSTDPAPEVAGIGGCSDTSPTASAIGGVDPYWQQYSYDALGDRSEEISHDTASVSQDTTANETTQQVAFTGANTTTNPYTQATSAQGQPDAAPNISITGPGGTAATQDTYNADGELTNIATTTTGTAPPTAPPGATMQYNALGQISSITTSAGTTNYMYDANGNLLLQSGPSSSTLYADGGAEQITATGNNLTGLRMFTNSPDGTTIDESSSGAITYQVVNQQGTATESVNASTLAITRRYYDPWGNQVGTPPSWPDNRGFLGKVTDSGSGFSVLGIRLYDPISGSFTSLDPVLETGDSRQMGGYSYAADNPVTGSDPSGTMPCIVGGPCGSIEALEHYEDTVNTPANGCPNGCQIGQNFEYPLITVTATKITRFVTVVVKFSGNVGVKDESNPFSVELSSSGAIENCSVALPDGAEVSVPPSVLHNLSGEDPECEDCQLSLPPIPFKLGGYDCEAGVSVSAAGEITFSVKWEGESHGFTGSGQLEVGLTFHGPRPRPADTPPMTARGAAVIPLFLEAETPEFKISIQAKPAPGNVSPLRPGSGSGSGSGSDENGGQGGGLPCAAAFFTPGHDALHAPPAASRVVLLACGPDGNELGGDGEGDGEDPDIFADWF